MVTSDNTDAHQSSDQFDLEKNWSWLPVKPEKLDVSFALIDGTGIDIGSKTHRVGNPLQVVTNPIEQFWNMWKKSCGQSALFSTGSAVWSIPELHLCTVKSVRRINKIV
jgi:hypothetical protein